MWVVEHSKQERETASGPGTRSNVPVMLGVVSGFDLNSGHLNKLLDGCASTVSKGSAARNPGRLWRRYAGLRRGVSSE